MRDSIERIVYEMLMAAMKEVKVDSAEILIAPREEAIKVWHEMEISMDDIRLLSLQRAMPVGPGIRGIRIEHYDYAALITPGSDRKTSVTAHPLDLLTAWTRAIAAQPQVDMAQTMVQVIYAPSYLRIFFRNPADLAMTSYQVHGRGNKLSAN